MTRPVDLVPLLKSLMQRPIADTLPECITLAPRELLSYASYLEIIPSDEINSRDNRRLQLRMLAADLEDTCVLENVDWSASVTQDRRLLDTPFSFEFLDKHEHVLLAGPTGVDKTFLAQAFGHAAVPAGNCSNRAAEE